MQTRKVSVSHLAHVSHNSTNFCYKRARFMRDGSDAPPMHIG